MNKEFIPYELSAELVEMGYDEPSEISIHYGVGDGHIAILYQQAFRWFREKYGLYYKILPTSDIKTFVFGIIDGDFNTFYEYLTYEKAELECLKKLIEITKNKQNEK